MTAAKVEKRVAAATVTDRGDAWGDQLWEVRLEDGSTVSIHASSEADARTAATAVLTAEGDE